MFSFSTDLDFCTFFMVPLILDMDKHSSVMRNSITCARVNFSLPDYASQITDAIALFSIASIFLTLPVTESLVAGALLKMYLEHLCIGASNGLFCENMCSLKNYFISELRKDIRKLC